MFTLTFEPKRAAVFRTTLGAVIAGQDWAIRYAAARFAIRPTPSLSGNASVVAIYERLPGDYERLAGFLAHAD